MSDYLDGLNEEQLAARLNELQSYKPPAPTPVPVAAPQQPKQQAPASLDEMTPAQLADRYAELLGPEAVQEHQFAKRYAASAAAAQARGMYEKGGLEAVKDAPGLAPHFKIGPMTRPLKHMSMDFYDDEYRKGFESAKESLKHEDKADKALKSAWDLGMIESFDPDDASMEERAKRRQKRYADHPDIDPKALDEKTEQARLAFKMAQQFMTAGESNSSAYLKMVPVHQRPLFLAAAQQLQKGTDEFPLKIKPSSLPVNMGEGVKRGVKTGVEGLRTFVTDQLGLESYGKFSKEDLDFFAAAQAARRGADTLRPAEGHGFVGKAWELTQRGLTGAAQMAPMMMAGGGAAGAAGKGALALGFGKAGVRLTQVAAGTAAWYPTMSADLYRDLRGKGFSEAASNRTAMVAAIPMALVEQFYIPGLGDAAKKAASQASRSAAMEYLKGFGKEFGEEVAQEAIRLASVAYMGELEKHVKVDWADEAKQSYESLKEAALALPFLMAPAAAAALASGAKGADLEATVKKAVQDHMAKTQAPPSGQLESAPVEPGAQPTAQPPAAPGAPPAAPTAQAASTPVQVAPDAPAARVEQPPAASEPPLNTVSPQTAPAAPEIQATPQSGPPTGADSSSTAQDATRLGVLAELRNTEDKAAFLAKYSPKQLADLGITDQSLEMSGVTAEQVKAWRQPKVSGKDSSGGKADPERAKPLIGTKADTANRAAALAQKQYDADVAEGVEPADALRRARKKFAALPADWVPTLPGGKVEPKPAGLTGVKPAPMTAGTDPKAPDATQPLRPVDYKQRRPEESAKAYAERLLRESPDPINAADLMNAGVKLAEAKRVLDDLVKSGTAKRDGSFVVPNKGTPQAQLAKAFADAGLTKQEQHVIEQRLVHGQTLDAIGKAQGVTRARIQQIEKAAMGKLAALGGAQAQSLAALAKQNQADRIIDDAATKGKAAVEGTQFTPEEAKAVRRKHRDKLTAEEARLQAEADAILKEAERAKRSGLNRRRVDETTGTGGQEEGHGAANQEPAGVREGTGPAVPGEQGTADLRSPRERANERAASLAGVAGFGGLKPKAKEFLSTFVNGVLDLFPHLEGKLGIRISGKGGELASASLTKKGQPVLDINPQELMDRIGTNPQYVKASIQEEAIHLDDILNHPLTEEQAKAEYETVPAALKSKLARVHQAFTSDPAKRTTFRNKVRELRRMREQVRRGDHITEWHHYEKTDLAAEIENELRLEMAAPPAAPAAQSTPAQPAVPPGITSIKNEVTAQEREERGMPAAVQEASRSFGQVWDEAMARPSTEIDALVADLAQNPKAVDDRQDAMLLRRQVELSNQYDQAIEALEAARQGGDPQAIVDAERAEKEISDKLLQLYDIDKKVGTATGRGLNARKMLAKEDFSLARMTARKRAANGGRALTQAEQEELVKAHQRIAELESQLAKMVPAGAKSKVGTRAERTRTELDLARRDFLKSLDADRRANQTVVRRAFGHVGEAFNLARSLITSMDLSYLANQAGFFLAGRPITTVKSLPTAIKAFASKYQSGRAYQELMDRPNAPLYQRSGLYLAQEDGDLSQREESFMSRLASDPEAVLGKGIAGKAAKVALFPVTGSQRAYTAGLNRVRADVFDAMVATIGKGGAVTDAEAKVIADFVNKATGRGGLGAAESAAVPLAHVFFSPRFVASRFQLLAGQPFYQGNLRTRTAIAKEYGRMLAGLGVFYGLMSMGGDEPVEWDARSSDFGKVKVGNTRIDPLFGLSQTAVLLTRLATGEKKTGAGKVDKIRGDVKFGRDDAFDVAANFLRSKFAPVLGTAVDVATEKDVVGNKVTPGSAAASLTVPLSFREVFDAMKEHGVPGATALGLLAMFGVRVQTYEERLRKAQ